MITDLFICSKPLQYLNAKNISHNKNSKRVLVMIPSFHKGEEFIEKIRLYDKEWDKVVCAPTVLASYRYLLLHKVTNLYMGFDNGSVLGMIITLKNINFFFFEEGNGMYKEYPYIKKKWRYVIDNIFGVSKFVGHSRYIKAAYVYDVIRYKNARQVNYPVYTFDIPFLDAISKYMNLFVKISSDSPEKYLNLKNKNILIYLTSWWLNDNILDDMKQNKDKYDFVFIKPHPHLLQYKTDIPNVKILPTNMMVEFLLFSWIDKGNIITVYHEGTSSVEYFDTKNIVSVKYNRCIN